MQYIFIPSPTGTHTRTSDSVRGDLRSFPDTTNIRSPHPILTSDEGFELVTAPAPTPPMPTLAQARAGISGLLASLPVESRAKFGIVRAAVEKLLDVGDIEAAHVLLTGVVTDTESEATVKSTILAALGNYLP